MATIELYKDKINSMSNYLSQARSAVDGFCADLSALKSKILSINSGVCDNIVSRISTSSQTQEQQIAGLEATQRQVNDFINLTINRDNSAASEVSKRKDDFYKKYSYLKPECEKSDWEKFCDSLKKVGEWCKEHWKEIVIAIEVIVAIACFIIPGMQGFGTAILMGMLKGAISGAIIGGIASWASGGSIIDGIINGALGGAMIGGAFGALGAAGSLFGATSSHMCSLFNGMSKVASVTGKLAKGMMAFDITALGCQVLNKLGFSNGFTNAIISTNQKCHSSKLYNVSQTLISMTAVATGSAVKSAEATGNTCFVAGTMVLTATGLVAIESLVVGDKVLSTNPDTLETSENVILETYVRKVDKLVHLVINGEEIVTTDNHPFYVQGRGFIEAGNLLVGDKLVSVNGGDLFVEEYNIELTDAPVSVYNFKVDEAHTYFVGDNKIWVHNASYQSNRSKYMGRTPSKKSRTGREVIERMETEGKIRNGPNGQEFQASDGKWYSVDKADMSHKTDAVSWWNSEGRQYGAKSPEVREFMLDSNNYELDLYSINRSQGPHNETYQPPTK